MLQLIIKKLRFRLKKRDDLINEVVLEVSVAESHLVHTHKLRFFAETEVNMLKLSFFNSKSAGSY